MTNLKIKCINILNEKNTFEFNMMKTIEELNELSTILLQNLNKPGKINKDKIIEEIGDVQIRLWWLKSRYSTFKIKKRIVYKLIKLNKYVNNR